MHYSFKGELQRHETYEYNRSVCLSIISDLYHKHVYLKKLVKDLRRLSIVITLIMELVMHRFAM